MGGEIGVFLKNKQNYFRFLIAGIFIFVTMFPFVVFPHPARAAPADAYWVGDGGNWSNAAVHWAIGSGGAPGAGNLPDATTDVHFDANSFTIGAQSVTVDAASFSKDMDWTGATNNPTLVIGAAAFLKTSGDATFIAAMSWTPDSTKAWYSVGTANITTNGLEIGAIYTISENAVVTLQDAFTTEASIYPGINLTKGTLNTNDQTITTNLFRTGTADAKILTLGSSTIICRGAAAFGGWDNVGTNLNLNAGTSTIIVNLIGAFDGGGYTYNNVELNGTAHTIIGSNTYNKLTVVNGATITVTGGTTQTFSDIEVGTNADLISSGGNYNLAMLGVAATGVGGGLTMTDATVTAVNAPANSLYWVQNGGNWTDDNNHWSLLSGFLPAGATVQIPTAAEDVYFDANSFYSGGQTVNLDAGADVRGMDWTGAPNFPSIGGANTLTIQQDLVLSATMIAFNPSQTIFAGTGNITTNGNDMNAVDFDGTAFVFLDNFVSGDSIVHTAGTITTNNFDFTGQDIELATAGVKVLNLGSSNVTTTGANGWDYSGGNLTLNEGTSTIVIGGTGQFAGGGETYNDVELNGTAHTIDDSNVFNTLTLPSGTTQTITFTDGTTQTIAVPVLSGSAGSVHTLQGTGAAGWNLASGGEQELEYLNITDSTVNPAFWYAGNSIDGGDNVNWRFGYRGMDENSAPFLIVSLATLVFVGMIIFVLFKIFSTSINIMTILVGGITIYVGVGLLIAMQEAITRLLTR